MNLGKLDHQVPKEMQDHRVIKGSRAFRVFTACQVNLEFQVVGVNRETTGPAGPGTELPVSFYFICCIVSNFLVPLPSKLCYIGQKLYNFQ